MFATVLSVFGLSRLKLLLIVGSAAGALAVLSGAYLKGRMDCAKAAEVRRLKAEIKFLKTSQRIARDDAEQGVKDAAAAARDHAKGEDLEDQADDTECLPRALSDGVRNLWR